MSQIGLGIVTVFETAQGPIAICNFHGKSRPGNKKDTRERIRQSEQVLKVVNRIPYCRVIGGDFNADIDTRCIQLFEDAGYINLIRAFEIPTTRNNIAWMRYPETPQLHADYIFVDRSIKVRRLTVPQNEVSDHLPMILNLV